MEGIVEFPTHSYGMIDPPKFLADNLESLIGAIFIDTNSSMDETWEVFFVSVYFREFRGLDFGSMVHEQLSEDLQNNHKSFKNNLFQR